MVQQRPRTALLATGALLVALVAPVAIATSAANAADVGGLATGFQIDGNKNGGTPPDTFDWDSFLTAPVPDGSYTFTPTGTYTTADGNESTGIVDASFAWDNDSDGCEADDATGLPGSQVADDNPWDIAPANVNAKANGCSSASAYEIIDVAGVDHYVLYQYWTRLEGNGDMSTYQLLQGPAAGRCDDILVEFNYDSAGDTTEVNILGWNGDCAEGGVGTWEILQADFPHDAAVGARVEGPDLPGEPATFGEIAVDLTAAGLFDGEGCEGFRAVGYVTRTGNSPNAQLIDFVGPGSDPLVIATCGTISVAKASNPPGVESGEIFDYDVTRSGGGDVHGETIVGTNLLGQPLVDADPTLQGISGTIGVGDSHAWGPINAGDDYELTETFDAAEPWALESIVCTVTNPGTGQQEVYTLVDDGEPTGEEFAVYPNVNTGCVMTNSTSFVEVEKITLPDGSAELFDFTIDGQGFDLADGDTETFQFAPGAEVDVVETVPDGWDLVDVTCDPAGTAIENGETVTTTAGATVHCAFTNEQAGTIIINKVVDGLEDAEFLFTSETLGDFSITTVGGLGSEDFPDLVPGAYAVAETPIDGYDTTNLVCTDPDGGTVVDLADFSADIDLDPGETVECTFTNTERGLIIVDKETIPDEYDQDFDFVFGGGEAPVDFTLNDANDDEVDPWNSGLIVPGTYTVDETVPENWTLEGISCGTVEGDGTTIELAPGQVVTCVFTNAAVPGSVELVKSVEGVSDDFAWSFDFTLTEEPDGAPVTQTVDSSALPDSAVALWEDLTVGSTYTLVEDELPFGWTADDIVCTGLEDADTEADGFQFEVTPGLELECTALNTAIPTEVDLQKTVTGLPEGSAWSFDFTLTGPDQAGDVRTATDAEPVVGWDGLIPGLTYTIVESATPGWVNGDITCTVDEGPYGDLDPEADGFQFMAMPGLVLLCSADNEALPGIITVTKSTVGGDGTFGFVLTQLGSDGDPRTREVTTVSGTAEAVFELVDAGFRYSIAETPVEGGWSAGPMTCEVTPASGGDAVAITAADFEVAPGDEIACAITNTFHPPMPVTGVNLAAGGGIALLLLLGGGLLFLLRRRQVAE